MVKDLSLNDYDMSLLKGGPIYALLVRAGMAQPGLRGMAIRIGAVIAVTWVALALITIWQGSFINSAMKVPFLYDFSELCRFLLVLPVLIAAESVVEPWLAQVISHCRRLVPDEDVDKFKSLIATSVRRRDSVAMEIALVLLAFIRPHVGDAFMPIDGTTWRTVTGTAEPTTAFLWYLYVAKPVVTLLWFRWLWKYIIWSLFLFQTSTLPLRVTPTHPDRMGGLGFLADGQAKFAILSFAYGVQIAGTLGQEILYGGATLMSFRYTILGVVALGLCVFLLPCLAFSPKLLKAKREGLLEYGALADQYTKAFHDKWIGGNRTTEEALIGNADIQSLADLSSSYSIVESMKCFAISKTAVMSFVVATLLPFVPLLLTVYPMDELLKRLIKAVL